MKPTEKQRPVTDVERIKLGEFCFDFVPLRRISGYQLVSPKISLRSIEGYMNIGPGGKEEEEYTFLMCQ